MKFIDEFDIELVNQNLSFDTVDSHVQGTIDLFTTKPIGSDRKLYKTIDKNWDLYLQEHQQQMQLNQQLQQQEDPILSPPINKFDMNPLQPKQRSYSTSTIKNRPMFINNNNNNSNHEDGLSKSFHSGNGGYISPSSLTDQDTCVFGPLHQQTSRRTFAYLIGILNTCYPDHDFSSLNPDFFKLISSSSVLVNNVNNLLISLGKSEQDLNWIWDIINGHMDLKDCLCFELDNDFLKEEVLNSPSVLWCNFYFLYNRKMKRVAFVQLKSVFILLRRGSLILNNFSRSQLKGSDNEYDLTNDIDEDVMMDEDEDEEDDGEDSYDDGDVVGDLEII